jgi:hypothetical protein
MIALLTRYWRIALPVVALLLLYVLFRAYVASEVQQARQDDAAQAQRIDAVADDVAGQVAAARASQIAQENEDARQAATDSDDPLRAGLDRLRAGKTGTGKAAD